VHYDARNADDQANINFVMHCFLRNRPRVQNAAHRRASHRNRSVAYGSIRSKPARIKAPARGIIFAATNSRGDELWAT